MKRFYLSPRFLVLVGVVVVGVFVVLALVPVPVECVRTIMGGC